MADAASFSELRDRLDAARKEYQHALEAQSEAVKFRSGVPDPDGTQLMYQTNQTLRIAFERYKEALKNLSDHVLKRTTRLGTVHVLLIEDNNADARLVREALAQNSEQVKLAVANNCAGAVAVISDHFEPHLIIADMGALEFGGVELIKLCNPHGIPVVVFSGSANPKEQENVLRLGVKEFIEKPSKLDEYTDAVWKIVSKWAAPQDRASTATNDH